MEVYEPKIQSIGDKVKNKNQARIYLDKDKILCNHCKRTASNGIRCLGICVADNEYQKNNLLKDNEKR